MRHILNEESLLNASSRSASRARTPKVDGEENGQLDINFLSIEELLTTKLESLQALLDLQVGQPDDLGMESTSNQDVRQKQIGQLNKARIQSGLTTINDIIYSLSLPRNEISSQLRELLLAQLYKLIVSKPLVTYNEENAGSSSYVSDDKVNELIKIFLSKSYRSDSEFLLMFRSCTALLCSDIEEFGYLVSAEFLGAIQQLLVDPPTSVVTNENKANLATGLCSLLLVLHNGSSSFGIDEKVAELLDIAEGSAKSALTLSQQLDAGDREYSTLFDVNEDKQIVNEATQKVRSEVNFAAATLHGAGCLLTLMPRGSYLNDFITEQMPKLVEMVDDDVNIEVAKAAGRIIGLCYEVFSYSEEDEDNDDDEDYNYNAPYYEQAALFSIIERLANLSTKKVSKKERKEAHSIFRDIAATLVNYTDVEKRTAIYRKSQEGQELLTSMFDSTYIKLSKTRSLPINSWFLYLRLIHLKWCFSFGVHNELVSNDSIRDILREPATDYELKYGTSGDHDPDDDAVPHANTDRYGDDEVKRTQRIRKARVNKLVLEMDELELR